MLILSRRLGEQILIGEDILVTIVDIDRGKVRIGITAPKDTKIYRTELLRKGQKDADSEKGVCGPEE